MLFRSFDYFSTDEKGYININGNMEPGVYYLEELEAPAQQWQRMWIAEDRDGYKRHLAAALFADVLQKGRSEEKHTGEKQEQEAERQQNEATVLEIPESKRENISPQQEAWNELKEKHPDAMQLVRSGNKYLLFNEDAVRSAELLGLTLNKRDGVPYGFTESAEFRANLLDSYLPEFIRAGERVVITDMIAKENRNAEQESYRGIHR